MTTQLKTLQEERNKKLESARAMIATPDFNNEEYLSLMDSIDGDAVKIENYNRLAEAEAVSERAVDVSAVAYGVSNDEMKDVQLQARNGYDAYLRHGPAGITDEHRAAFKQMSDAKRAAAIAAGNGDLHQAAALGVGTQEGGGFLVPDEGGGKFLEAVTAYGGVRQVANIISTGTGAAMPFPTVDATAQLGARIAENAANEEQGTSFGEVSMGSSTYTSNKVLISRELLQDSMIDLGGYLSKALTERIARILNQEFTNGNGSNKPQGIVAGVSNVVAGGSGTETAITHDVLLSVEHNVDPAYRTREGTGWMFHDNTCRQIKQLKDSAGRPIWLPGDASIAGGYPNTLLGYPYTINQDMDEMGDQNKSILFGNLKQYYVRDVLQVEVFRVDGAGYIEKRQVGFMAHSRHDGRWVTASEKHAVVYKNGA